MQASLPAPLRRVGCAIVQCPWMRCRTLANRGEVLTGTRQEVGRGELWAFLMALRCTAHNLIYVCDRRSVYDGWHAQAWNSMHLAESDLWRQVPEAAVVHKRVVLVMLMESHQGVEHSEEVGTEARTYFTYGNDRADDEAKERRRAGAVPPS